MMNLVNKLLNIPSSSSQVPTNKSRSPFKLAISNNTPIRVYIQNVEKYKNTVILNYTEM